MPIIVREPEKKVKPKLSGCLYTWVEEHGEYFLKLSETESIHVYPRDGHWEAEALLNGKKHVGARDTLEAAFKAVDRVFYEVYPHYWTRTNVRAIISPWMGELNR